MLMVYVDVDLSFLFSQHMHVTSSVSLVFLYEIIKKILNLVSAKN